MHMQKFGGHGSGARLTRFDEIVPVALRTLAERSAIPSSNCVLVEGVKHRAKIALPNVRIMDNPSNSRHITLKRTFGSGQDRASETRKVIFLQKTRSM
jgi:hypothetical protein